jgi:hypothetical protein
MLLPGHKRLKIKKVASANNACAKIKKFKDRTVVTLGETRMQNC